MCGSDSRRILPPNHHCHRHHPPTHKTHTATRMIGVGFGLTQRRSFSPDRSLKSVTGPLGDPLPREGDDAAAGAAGMMMVAAAYSK